MKKRNVFLPGLLVILLAMGLVLAGCDDDSSGDNGGNNSSSNNSGDNSSNGNSSGGSSNGNSSSGDNSNGNSSSGGNSNGGNSSGGNTFTPPKKSQIEAFVEDYRKNTTIMNNPASAYIKSITINTYTVDGTSITSSPSPVPEDAEVQVKFTLKTILGSNGYNMGEKLNIDNFRVDLQSALTTWLKSQGFKSSNINVTTGSTTFG